MSNRHSHAGPDSAGYSVGAMPWTMRSGLDTSSPQSSPLNDGPGTVYSDDEDMLFEGPTETSFVFSITEGAPSPRSHKGKEGLLPSKYKPRDSGIVLNDDESMPARNPVLSTSSSSIYSDNDSVNDLVAPGIVPGAFSGWPRISDVDDTHLHSFDQSHPYQYLHHDEDDVDAFILCTLEAGGKPSAAEGKKLPGTPVKKLKSHFGLDGERPWQCAVASKIRFSFDGAEGPDGNGKKAPRKSLPAAFPIPLGKGHAGTSKGAGSDTEEDEDTVSPSSKKQCQGLGFGRPAGRWLMRRSSSRAFSSGESASGTPIRRNVNLKGVLGSSFINDRLSHFISWLRLADARSTHFDRGDHGFTLKLKSHNRIRCRWRHIVVLHPLALSRVLPHPFCGTTTSAFFPSLY
jgi:mitosis inhibitor protein kinase SWE1